MTEEGSTSKPYEYKIGEVPKKDASKPKGEPGKNLWQSILSEVVKRDDLEDSHLLLLGDSGVGKRSIVREINKFV